MPLPTRRLHRIAVSCFFFLTGLCFASWASRIPAIKDRLELSDAALGGILFSLPVGLVTSLPVAGFLVARFGSRIVAIVASFSYAIILPVLGLAATTAELVATLFVFGFAGNMLNISINTQAVGTEAFYNPKPIMASFHGIWSLAGFTGAAIGTLMVRFGVMPVWHFCCITAVVFAIIIGISRWLVQADAAQGDKQPIFARPDKSILNLGLIAFCSMICEGAMFDWSGIYFSNIVRPGAAWVTVGYTAFMSTMAAGRFVGDWVAFRLGMKRMLQLSGICISSGLLLAVLFPQFVTATLGFMMVGAGVSSVVPMVYSAAGKSKKMSAGVAIAAVSTVGYMGFLFGPPFIGFIAQASSLRVSLGLIAIMGTLIVLLAARMKSEPRTEDIIAA